MKTLQEIYDEVIKEFPNRHTDKGMGAYGPVEGGPGHTYAGFYDLLFAQYRKQPINFLEVGINRGGSLLMWRRFFDSATINGVDIRDSFDPFTDSDDINAKVFDAGDVFAFDKHFGDNTFDIILDDGAHEKESQVHLYKLHSRRVRSGGLYVIEDVQDVNDNLDYFLEKIEKRPTIIDRRFQNGQLDDVLLVYRF